MLHWSRRKTSLDSLGMAAEPPRQRRAPLELSPEEFRKLGHALVEDVSSFLETLPQRPVAPGERAPEVRALLPVGGVPLRGSDPEELLDRNHPASHRPLAL